MSKEVKREYITILRINGRNLKLEHFVTKYLNGKLILNAVLEISSASFFCNARGI